ncbi:MAG: HAD family hydrolase [Bacilli bacterium]|nr:HAD family hydrolase [Bacilli bacterium]MBN2876645.1 HAD family hydrolase [Bacilli bacterium]
MYKAVIFDLDGTLLDTIEDISDSVNQALVSLGYPTFEISDYKYFVGRGVDELITSVIETGEMNPDDFYAIKTGYLQEYGIRKSKKTKPYPGVLSLLENLKQMNIKLCILSNKPHYQTEEVVQTYFQTIHFDIVFGKKPEYQIKPDPSSAKAIQTALNLSDNEILYVGDTDTDMQTAINANYDSVGVLWGFRTESELIASKATYIIKDPSELIAIIEGDKRDRFLANRNPH